LKDGFRRTKTELLCQFSIFNVKNFQQSVLGKTNASDREQLGAIPPHLLHVTVATFSVDGASLDAAKSALASAAAKMKQRFTTQDQQCISFGRLSTFSAKYLIVLVNEEQRLRDIYTIVCDEFEAHGIPTLDENAFMPHMSLFRATEESSVDSRQ